MTVRANQLFSPTFDSTSKLRPGILGGNRKRNVFVVVVVIVVDGVRGQGSLTDRFELPLAPPVFVICAVRRESLCMKVRMKICEYGSCTTPCIHCCNNTTVFTVV